MPASRQRRLMTPLGLAPTALVLMLITGASGVVLSVQAAVAREPLGHAPSARDAGLRLLAQVLRAEDERDASASALSQALASPDAGVRRRAVLALGRIGESRSMPQLLKALADGVPSVQHEAAFALGQLADVGAFDSLASATLSEDPELAARAAEALAKLGWKDVAARQAAGGLVMARVLGEGAATSRSPAAVARALRAAWRFGAGTAGLPEAVTRFSAHADDEVAEAAAYCAHRVGDPALGGLLAALVADPRPAVRGLAARGLGRLAADDVKAGRPPDTVQRSLVASATHDGDRDVRIAALMALGSFPAGDASVASEVLTGSLASTDHHVQRAALALARAWQVSSTATLIETLLASDRPDLAADAAAALVAVRGLEALPALGRAAESREWTRRAAVAGALTQPSFGEDPGARALQDRLLADVDPRVVASALAAIAESHRPGAAVIALAHLGSPDVVVRAVAAGVLPDLVGNHLREPEATTALRRAVREAAAEPAADARVSALEGLSNLLGEQAGPDLAQALTHPDFTVRLRASALAREAGADLPPGRGEAGVVGTARPLSFYLEAAALEREARPLVLILETTRGPVLVDLATARAPLTVLQLAGLAGRSFFDGLTFHRVVPGFVAQAGCPRGDGWGGPGETVRCEIDDAPYVRGAAGMALSGKDTGGSQFFFTLTPQPHLEGRYTVFGQVRSESLAVVDDLHRFDRILSARVETALVPAGRRASGR